MSIQLVEVEVLPGLVLALYPWQDIAATAEELSDFFGEVDSQPGLGWEPDEDELEQMYLDKCDPTWVAWQAEGGPVAGFSWSGDYSDVRVAEEREDWIGA